VAMFCLPLLLAAFSIPLTTVIGRSCAVFLVAFCFWTLPTNQIHQWAHMPSPPKIARILQRCGLVLGRQHHRVHHDAPFATNYCIINGWCNGTLAKIHFFRRMERGITFVTGLTPRAEEECI
jgi:plasmanylethanolamine desaturase